MPKYAFVAVTSDGNVAKGIQEAETLAAARLVLQRRNLRVTELNQRTGWAQISVTTARLRAAELMHLSRQLAAFLRAGIPILDAIAVLEAEADRPAVRRVLEALGADLRSGATLADAVERHPRDFPEFYRGILRSAELTGRLDTVLDQLATYLERDLEARRKIKAALIYPAIVAAMSSLTVVVLSVFVLPKFESFFASLDAQLPLPTRMLLGTTRFIAGWWWLIVTVVLVLALLGAVWTRTRRGRLVWHSLQLRVPVAGGTLRYSIIERFTRILASMVSAGVPLPTAMTVATNSLHNAVFERALESVRVSMMQGAGLAYPISTTRLFPGVAAQMIRVGEDTGTLDTQLEVAAAFYEQELDYKVKKLTATIEPVVIAVMGSVVGFVAIALVSAMYGIFRTAHLQ